MCVRLGYRVETLVRIRIGGVALGELRPGEVRPLTAGEVRLAVAMDDAVISR
jgi:16S rRNA U516 pseudouridylate synthase RsuA-like enzyme